MRLNFFGHFPEWGSWVLQIYDKDSDWCVDLPDPYPYSDGMGAKEQRTQAPWQQVGDKVLDWGANCQTVGGLTVRLSEDCQEEMTVFRGRWGWRVASGAAHLDERMPRRGPLLPPTRGAAGAGCCTVWRREPREGGHGGHAKEVQLAVQPGGGA